jgi:hypothetical protein
MSIDECIKEPVCILKLLVVMKDYSWVVYVYGEACLQSTYALIEYHVLSHDSFAGLL